MRKSTFKKMRAEQKEYQSQFVDAEVAKAAFHEGGHALAHELFRTGIKYAEIYDGLKQEKEVLMHGGGVAHAAVSTGFTQPEPRLLATLDDLELEYTCVLAGPAAEWLISHDNADVKDEGDNTDLVRLAQHMKISPDDFPKLYEKTFNRVQEVFATNAARLALNEIGNILIDKKLISGEEVRAIVDRIGRAKMLESLTIPDSTEAA